MVIDDVPWGDFEKEYNYPMKKTLLTCNERISVRLFLSRKQWNFFNVYFFGHTRQALSMREPRKSRWKCRPLFCSIQEMRALSLQRKAIPSTITTRQRTVKKRAFVYEMGKNKNFNEEKMSFIDIFKLRKCLITLTRTLGPYEYFCLPEQHPEFDPLDERNDNIDDLDEFKEDKSDARKVQDEEDTIIESLLTSTSSSRPLLSPSSTSSITLSSGSPASPECSSLTTNINTSSPRDDVSTMQCDEDEIPKTTPPSVTAIEDEPILISTRGEGIKEMTIIEEDGHQVEIQQTTPATDAVMEAVPSVMARVTTPDDITATMATILSAVADNESISDTVEIIIDTLAVRHVWIM